MSGRFPSKQLTDTDDDNMVYTMGGLDSLPDDSNAGDTDVASYLSRAIPNLTFDQFTGSLDQLAQLFPGVQIKPSYQPTLTDLTFTRGYYGPQQDVSPEGYGTESAGHLFWSPQRYQMPLQFTTSEEDDEERRRRSSSSDGGSGIIVDGTDDSTDDTSDDTTTDTVTGGNTVDTITGGNTVDTITGGNTTDNTSTLTESQNTVSKIYDSLFEREADVEGRDYWASKLDQGTPLDELLRQISGSATEEDKARISQGEVDQVLGELRTTEEQRATNDEFVEQAYQNLFDRDAEQEGLDYWSSQLDAGKSQTDVLRDMVAGAQGTDVQTAANTQTVNDLYKQLLDRDADEAGLDYYRSQLAAGATPEEVARNIISGAQAGEEASKISQEEYDRYMQTLNIDTYRTTLQEDVDASSASFTNVQNELADLRNQAQKEIDASGRFESAGEGETAFVYSITDPYATSVGEQLRAKEAEYRQAFATLSEDTNRLNDIEKNFAAASYANQNPEVAKSGLDPYTHYLIYDRGENSYFVADPNAFYLQNNPDVANSGYTPYEHYLLKGYTEGRKDAYGTPEQEYLRAYADAAEGVRNGTYASAADHYAKVGAAEGRTAGFGELNSALKSAADSFLADMERNPPEYAITGETLRSDFANSLITNSPAIINGIVKGATGSEARTLLAEGAVDLVNEYAATEAGRELLLSYGITDETLETFNEALLGGEAIAGGLPVLGLIMDAFTAEDFTDFAGNAAATMATYAAVQVGQYALASLGIPGAGPFIAAAIALDAVLAEALGYDSFIQDGLSWVSRKAEKAVSWIGKQLGSDPLGAIGDFFGWAEGGMVRYQEGGLVDLPGEMPYSYTNYYGALGQPQQLAQPFMPQQQPQAEQNPPLSLDEVQPEMAFAGGGLIPLVGGGKIASGPGGGLDDLIPTSIDGRRAAALSDGEFVIPADVVSMMGDGSSNAGAKRLYDMVRQVRQVKTGTSKQAGPLPVGKILERTMS